MKAQKIVRVSVEAGNWDEVNTVIRKLNERNINVIQVLAFEGDKVLLLVEAEEK